MANCHRFAAGATASRNNGTDVVVTTVHDETGFANLVVWSSLFDRQRRIVLSARMLRCLGHMQREGDIIYVVAVQLETRRVNAAMSATDSSRTRYHMVVATGVTQLNSPGPPSRMPMQRAGRRPRALEARQGHPGVDQELSVRARGTPLPGSGYSKRLTIYKPCVRSSWPHVRTRPPLR